MFARLFANLPFAQGLEQLVQELVRAGAATWHDGVLQNA